MRYRHLFTIFCLATVLWLAPSPGVAGTDDSGHHPRVFNWAEDGGSHSVEARGAVSFSEDDRGVAALAPDGCLVVREEEPQAVSEVQVCRPGSDPGFAWSFTVNGEARSEAEGWAWLAARLPYLIRRTGLGVESRVAAILREGGWPGLEAELDRLPRAWVQALYLEEAARTVSGTDARGRILRAAVEALREEPGELAAFLHRTGSLYLAHEPLATAYVEAVGDVEREREVRDLLLAAARREGLSEEALVEIADRAAALPEGSYKLELLQGLAPALWSSRRGQDAFFRATDTLEEGHYRETLLTDLARRDGAADEVLREVLDRIAAMPSGWRRERALQEVAEPYLANDALRPLYLEVIEKAGVERSAVSAGSGDAARPPGGDR